MKMAPLLALCMTARLLAAQAAEPDSLIPPNAEAGGGGTLVPLPVLFYQPETGTGFGAIASYYFRLGDASARGETRTSYVSLMAIRTVKEQTILWLQGDVFPAGGRYRMTGEGGYSRFPTKYWGIGNETPAAAEEDYTPDTFKLTMDVQRRLSSNWYAGPTMAVTHRRLVETAPGGVLESASGLHAASLRVVGVGGVLAHDSRDNTVFPRAGGFDQVRFVAFPGALGSEFEYATLTGDVRRYVSPAPGHVVAVRALVMATVGDLPFDLLPKVGGDVLLRGYYDGRFRDGQLVALQGEYRSPALWRFGVVGFVAAGQVRPAFDDFRLDAFKTTVGAGLRMQLSRREGLNIRADYGWGLDVHEGGFYLAIGEAF